MRRRLIASVPATTVAYHAGISDIGPPAAKIAEVSTEIYISYEDGRGLLQTIPIGCTKLRFAIDRVRLDENRNLIGEEASDLADNEGVEVGTVNGEAES